MTTLRRTVAVALMAGGAMLLAPAPAHAEYVCWMSDGIRYCYDPNDGKVPVEPDPVPVEPTYVPTPPAPSVEQPWIQPVPVEPGPVQPLPAQPAPVPAAPQPAPVPVPMPVPVYVPPTVDGYYAPAAAAPAPAAEVAPAEPVAAEAASAAAVPTASASPTAATAPSPAVSPSGAVASTTGQPGSAEPFDGLPVVLVAGGVLAVAAVAWLVPPFRRALLSLARLE
ncbi:hypothetical protein [Pseudarthrobacter sp. BIM B-2242]|uniref:hypothetical protein n=1 Tax=Pseudarthrobacter sp. BIM B-2242 TaxID=2772401 RepID=UPI00168A92B3|nr:hypothetical protein [Pseudarthrobacter sp. BIM B-2242]QOD04327.1 hypothetical protein IDT60_04495 [Pseudarthrobacter sp. BIM B-2242]